MPGTLEFPQRPLFFVDLVWSPSTQTLVFVPGHRGRILNVGSGELSSSPGCHWVAE